MEEERITAEKVEKTEKKVKIDIDRYRAKEGEKISLKKFSTNCDMDVDKEYVKTVSMTAALEELSLYQAKLYAQNTYGLIIVLQAMDAAGKDGTIKHVFSHLDPNGVHVVSFKQPTTEEKDHDYMWRINKALPRRGSIGIFNRSHYEDVVMPHVYGTYPEDVWRARYDQINDFERELAASGCAILKIFLVVSQEEQKKHFLGRLDDPTKFWKFDISDLEARDRWDEYMAAWQEVFEKTSTAAAPWYLVPADNRWYSRAVVSELLRTTLKNMNMTWPPLEPEVDPDEVRRRLA